MAFVVTVPAPGHITGTKNIATNINLFFRLLIGLTSVVTPFGNLAILNTWSIDIRL